MTHQFLRETIKGVSAAIRSPSGGSGHLHESSVCRGLDFVAGSEPTGCPTDTGLMRKNPAGFSDLE